MERLSDSPRPDALHRWSLPIGAIALLGAGVFLLSAIGEHDPVAGVAAVIESALGPGLISVVWVVGAIGLGAALLRTSWTLGACVGVALMLAVAHLLGVFGAFSGRSAQVLAWAPVVVGVGLFAWRCWKRPPRLRSGAISPVVLAAAPALAVLIVAASLPAGTIWESEARGYDVLSYHLQLPGEWRRLGQIEPLPHNVYSFLPSCMESAYTQLDAMIGGPGPGLGLGLSALAAQFLHAMLGLLAALATGRFAAAALERSGTPVRVAPALLSGIVLLSVPWVVVTASMAYNEMGVLVGFAGAMLAVMLPTDRPIVRGAVIGALCGGAASCKPTAMFMCVPGVMLAVLWVRPRREWIAVLAGAAGAGLLMIAPWLIRNAMHGGNPVFPFLTGLFGTAHWSDEQVARWTSGHAPDGGLIGRVGLLFSAKRGLLHGQWSAFPWIGLAGLAACLIDRRTRRIGALIGAIIGAILVGWLLVGHQQPRFLIPLAVPGAAAVGIGVGAMARRGRRPVWLASGAACALTLGVHAAVIFARQNGGHPNLALVDGATALNGARAIESWPALSAPERERVWEVLGPFPATSLALSRQPGSKVYLLGDATPMYLSVPTVYHSTWDRSPVGAALRADADPLAALRSLGVTHVLINFSELARLRDDGWHDPLVTPEFVRDELLPRLMVVRVWDELGVVLAALPPRPASVDPRQ